jgi:hypothetical protein
MALQLFAYVVADIPPRSVNPSSASSSTQARHQFTQHFTLAISAINSEINITSTNVLGIINSSRSILRGVPRLNPRENPSPESVIVEMCLGLLYRDEKSTANCPWKLYETSLNEVRVIWNVGLLTIPGHLRRRVLSCFRAFPKRSRSA